MPQWALQSATACVKKMQLTMHQHAATSMVELHREEHEDADGQEDMPSGIVEVSMSACIHTKLMH